MKERIRDDRKTYERLSTDKFCSYTSDSLHFFYHNIPRTLSHFAILSASVPLSVSVTGQCKPDKHICSSRQRIYSRSARRLFWALRARCRWNLGLQQRFRGARQTVRTLSRPFELDMVASEIQRRYRLQWIDVSGLAHSTRRIPSVL